MTVRVLSYPPVHDYVDRLHPTSAELVHREEPWPELPGFYDPGWLRRHRDDWEVAHLHFTWEQYPPQRVEEVLRTHRQAGTPVVWTAHDLRNPHTLSAERDQPFLELLATYAHRVITLTDGAAGEIARRFGRTAHVIPHGPLFSGPASRRWRQERSRVLGDRDGTTRLLLHLRSVRSNVDWRTPMDVVAELHREGVRVQLDVLVLEDAPRIDDVRATGTARGVDVQSHARLSFEELTRRMIAADALLLPYLWGTHSGMLELATDLGIPVIAGRVGYLDEQAPVLTVPVTSEGLDAGVLAEHVRRIVAGQRPPVVAVGTRERTLLRFRREHAALYRRPRRDAMDRSA